MMSAAAAEDQPSTGPAPEAAPGVPVRREIMVVDDHDSVTRALSALLKNAGYDAVSFNSGLAALQHIKHHRPDAVILDIHMPDLSGLVLSQEMRSRLSEGVPIIVLSGDASMETINSLPLVGATYFFSKPVNSTRLLDQLKELLGEGKVNG